MPIPISSPMSWIRALFGVQVVTQNGIPVPQRPTIEYPTGTLTDDPVNQRTVYTPPGAGVLGVYPAQPNTIPLRGSLSEGLFGFVALTGTNLAGSGFVRLTSDAQAAIAAQAVGGHWDIPLIGIDGDDGVLVGEPAHTQSITLQIASGAEFQLGFSTGSFWYDPTPAGISIGGQILNLGATRTSVGSGSTYGQFIRNPRATSSGGTPWSIDWDGNGSHVDLTITANATLSASTNVVAGGRYTITVRQGAGGPYTMTWDATFKFGSSFTGTLTNVAGAVDIFEFIGDSSNMLRCIGASKGVQ